MHVFCKYAIGNVYKIYSMHNSKKSKCPDWLTCVIFIHNKNKLHFMQEHVRISENIWLNENKQVISFLFIYLFIYLFDREIHSERGIASRRRGRSRLPAEQGAQCGARSQDPGIMTWAEGRRLMTEPPRHPKVLKKFWINIKFMFFKKLSFGAPGWLSR